MDSQRIRRGTPATVSVLFTGDETPIDPDGPAIDVTVTGANGTEVASGAATRAGTGAYTFNLPAQSSLNVLSIDWAGEFDGTPTTITTYADVVGGEYFTIAELRDFDSVLSNTTKYPYAKLVAARAYVEAEFEGICERAFVASYAREVLYGGGTCALWLANPEPLRLISLTVNDEDWSSKQFTTPQYNLRVISAPADSPIPRAARVVIEYEYGKDIVPLRIKNAALKRAKYILVADQSRIDERATTMNIPDFGNFILATPGIRGSKTGIPEVDVVLDDYMLGNH